MNNLKMKLLVALPFISVLIAPVASAVVLSGSLARVNYSGNITNYIDNTGSGQYNGVSDFNGSYLIDSSSSDIINSDPNVGLYKVGSPNFAGFQSGANNFGSAKSKMLILNDFSAFGTTIDAYIAKNTFQNTRTNEMLVWGVRLIDLTASAFNSDAWMAEPPLSSYTTSTFFLKSFNLTTYALNYALKGNVTYLKDPTCVPGNCGNAGNLNLVRVPEPSIMLMFLLGLATLGFYSKSRKKMH